jgi:hypothetical protein
LDDDTWIKVIDWGGWVLSNVLIGAFFPLAAMGLMHLLKAIQKGTQAISYTAPFRDGQLGFVSVGWVVSALVEILKFSIKHPGTSLLVYTILLMLMAFVSALVAAAGAVSPVAAPATPPKLWWPWILTYPAFSASAALCVLTLPLTAIVHGVTS